MPDVAKWTAIFIVGVGAVVLYFVVVIPAVRSEYFIDDLRAFFAGIWSLIYGIVHMAVIIGQAAAHLGDLIKQAFIAIAVHWILLVAVTAVVIIICFGGGIFLVYQFAKTYVHKFKFADWISHVVLIVSGILVIWFADPLREIMPINLIVLIIIIQFIYMFIRMLISSDELRYGRW